jgi:hypothetical protein
MIEGAQLVYDDVASIVPESAMPMVQVERPVQIPRIHPAQRGAVDVCIDLNDTLYVWEYKFGHRPIDVFENDQGVAYAAGLLPPETSDTKRIVITVIQPRAYHHEGVVRRWSTTWGQIKAQVELLKGQVAEALGPNPRLTPHPKACVNCPARAQCPALQEVGYIGIQVAHQAQPLELSDFAVGNELRLLTEAQTMLKARISGLEEQAKSRIAQGRVVAHWAMVAGGGNLAWACAPAEVGILGELFGKNLMKPADPVTPTQALQLGMDEAILKGYTRRKSGAVKLVLDDGSKARRIFS